LDNFILLDTRHSNWLLAISSAVMEGIKLRAPHRLLQFSIWVYFRSHCVINCVSGQHWTWSSQLWYTGMKHLLTILRHGGKSNLLVSPTNISKSVRLGNDSMAFVLGDW